MVNTMLLNGFFKDHKKVEQQRATITELKKELHAGAARQRKQIEALTAGLQKVSAQPKHTRPANGGEQSVNTSGWYQFWDRRVLVCFYHIGPFMDVILSADGRTEIVSAGS